MNYVVYVITPTDSTLVCSNCVGTTYGSTGLIPSVKVLKGMDGQPKVVDYDKHITTLTKGNKL